MKKILVGTLILLLTITIGAMCYWNWNFLHNSKTVSPTSNVDDRSADNSDNSGIDKERSNRINILVLGTDNHNNEISRTDTIILISADRDTKHVSVISIPRDTKVYIEGVGTTKINHANSIGTISGGVHQGTMETIKAVSNLLGVDINYYVKVNFEGFVKAVDSVGGVDINLPYAINDKSALAHFPAGEQHFTGEDVLKLIRARYSMPNGDFDRQKNQYLVISAIARKVLSSSDIDKLPKIAEFIEECLTDTNITIPEFLSLGLTFKDITKEDIKYYQLPGHGITEYDELMHMELYYFELDMDGVGSILQEAFNHTP